MKQQGKRWYEQHKTVLKSVELLETFPEEIQVVIAEGIIRLAERECQANEALSNLRSLGPDKVLGIFKSKNRRRTYDKTNPVHQAMNYLFILSEQNRVFIANQVIELVNLIYEYLKICQMYQVSAQLEEVSEMVRLYMEGGTVEAYQMLEASRKRLQLLGPAKVEIPGENIAQNVQGLKVQEDRKS